MRRCGSTFVGAFTTVLLITIGLALAWTPLAVSDDPLVRMPGSQPDQGVFLEGPNRCLNCHGDYNQDVEPGYNWKGSMMTQASRDFLFWASMTVTGQDSIWALGTPNAMDICERCHFPEGWLEGRSDPPNASAMTGSDYDGLSCDFCHRMWNPFFEDTYNGTREGNDWVHYWDEAGPLSGPAADETYAQDVTETGPVRLFNGSPFFGSDNRPFSPGFLENGGGQFFVTIDSAKRSSFADANAKHKMLYSRYNKSKYFCGTCHDVSNPALANLGQSGTAPLTSESDPAYSYFHVERTFSEFMLSDYGLQGGAPGVGPYDPAVFETSLANNNIARCQDCHMRDVVGAGCNKNGVPVRPTESTEHPMSGQPLHDLTGGNAWVTAVLASAVPGSPNYDPVNDQLLNQGAALLTLDLTQGEGIDPVALLDGAGRAKDNLQNAAAIEGLTYDPGAGDVKFRIVNQTPHKLISGYPEGRRMFANIRAYVKGSLVYEVNPYDADVGTLKGLPLDYSPSSPPLGQNEGYEDKLVFEVHSTSSLTGEDESFHMGLATGRWKDNRIPPKGFRIAEAAARICEPVVHGVPDPNYFSTDEYAGGYHDVQEVIPAGADLIEVNLFYQTTSREFIEFLRDEINGTATTLTSPTPSGEPQAYVIQTDPFFSKLRAWGDTIWQLWDHNKQMDGAAPFLMAQKTYRVPGGSHPLVKPAVDQAIDHP
jgi:hypothetical protein